MDLLLLGSVEATIGIVGWSADYGTPSTFARPYLCSSFQPRTRCGARCSISSGCAEPQPP
jgi:hypothetical protein